jgi:hypothetical protein
MKSKDFGRTKYKIIFYNEDNEEVFPFLKVFNKLSSYRFSGILLKCCLQIYLFFKYKNFPNRAKRHGQFRDLSHKCMTEFAGSWPFKMNFPPEARCTASG